MSSIRECLSDIEILRDINTFVEEKLKDYKAEHVHKKTIHDPIWGSSEYNE